MTFAKLSAKQKQVFKWCYKSDYSAIICDGAVRSGKTICMITSFILWAMKKFNGATFGICGKTVRSAERNIIIPIQSIADLTCYFRISYSRSANMLTVEGNGVRNNFFVFGGKDESSYMLIQGITLSGVLFDEVALMPRSFVEQAITRTLSVQGAKLWFNCNPDKPNHWFYTDWIKKADERRALHLHFLMSDNPTLSDEQLENADRQFSGVFHDRYIKGLWVTAEGVIYKQFADNNSLYVTDNIPDDILFCTIGFDFGGNGSAHAGICTGYSKRFRKIIVLDEYYRKEIITPTELEDDIAAFIRRCQARFNVHEAYFDNAETTLLRGVKRRCAKEHLPIEVKNAKKTEILGRIRLTNMIMSQMRFAVISSCTNFIAALNTAVWDDDPAEDIRVDDGNYNIDSLDAFEYSIEPYMKQIIDTGVIN